MAASEPTTDKALARWHGSDLAAFAGVVLSLAALALPWARQRSCPLFEDCGPWRAVSGWEAFGPTALAGLALVLLFAFGVTGPIWRRVLPAVGCLVVGAFFLHDLFWSSFVVFGDHEPSFGAAVFAAGLALSMVGWVAGAVQPPRVPADRLL